MLNDTRKFDRLINQGRCPRCSEDFCVKHEVSQQQKRVLGSYLCLKCYNHINKLRKDLLIIELENGIHYEEVDNKLNYQERKKYNFGSPKVTMQENSKTKPSDK